MTKAEDFGTEHLEWIEALIHKLKSDEEAQGDIFIEAREQWNNYTMTQQWDIFMTLVWMVERNL